MMRWKNSKLYSIVTFKCPRCHEGDMFYPGTLYNPARFDKMHKKCGHCGQDFEQEPGFYFGAMFVSYAISTALFVTAWIALTILMEEVTISMMVMAVVLVIVGLLPVNFRLSRVMWINIFVRYEESRSSLKQERVPAIK